MSWLLLTLFLNSLTASHFHDYNSCRNGGFVTDWMVNRVENVETDYKGWMCIERAQPDDKVNYHLFVLFRGQLETVTLENRGECQNVSRLLRQEYANTPSFVSSYCRQCENADLLAATCTPTTGVSGIAARTTSDPPGAADYLTPNLAE